MRKMFSLLAIWMLTLAAVPALADIPPEPKSDPDAKSDEVKLPWTAEEVQKAWGKGVSFLYDTEANGLTGWARIEAENVTDKGFKDTSIMCDKGKVPTKQYERETSWEKHLGRIEKDLAGYEKSVAEVEVPLGKLACDVYTMKTERGTLKQALSKKVPGTVVMFEVESKKGDRREHVKCSLRSIDKPVMQSPWTYDKIAENWKDGCKTVYTSKASFGNGKDEYEVTACDIDGMTTVSTQTMEGREPEKNEARTFTWDAYFRFFMPPRHGTESGEETLKTAAGEYKCVVFTHKTEQDGARYMQKVWLAKDEPGLLVRCDIEQEKAGKKMFIYSELSEYSKGKK